MKKTLRTSILLTSALLITLALSSCGSDHSVPWASTSFAYLQANSASQSDRSLVQPHSAKQLHTLMNAGPRKGLQRLAAATTVDIAAGNFDLYVMDTATGKTVQLNTATLGSPVTTSAAFMSAQLSTDGTKLLVSAYDSAGYIQLYVADAKLQTITQLTTGESYHLYPSFSADGKTIIYSDENDLLYTIPSGGGTVTAIPMTGTGWSPVFTPDGKKIVFSSCPESCLIYVMPITGGTATALSTGTDWDGYPAVSPDGTQVAFVREGNSAEDIAVISINGETTANPAKILTSGAYSTGGSLEPQYLGSKILFVSFEAQNYPSIFEMNADGSNVVPLTTSTTGTVFNLYSFF